jgi:hypothetical protein
MTRIDRQPRTRCRLPCIIRAGRGRVRARVLDLSSGGLCFVAPVCFKPNVRVRVEIVVPRGEPVAIEGNVRHRRPYRQPSSGRRGWATGLAIATAGPEFLALTSPGVLAEANDGDEVAEVLLRFSDPAPPIAPEFLAAEQSLYRVRLKAIGSSRTRTLTLRAASESAVCEAVLRDLPGDWEVLGVEVDPID